MRCITIRYTISTATIIHGWIGTVLTTGFSDVVIDLSEVVVSKLDRRGRSWKRCLTGATVWAQRCRFRGLTETGIAGAAVSAPRCGFRGFKETRFDRGHGIGATMRVSGVDKSASARYSGDGSALLADP